MSESEFAIGLVGLKLGEEVFEFVVTGSDTPEDILGKFEPALVALRGLIQADCEQNLATRLAYGELLRARGELVINSIAAGKPLAQAVKTASRQTLVSVRQWHEAVADAHTQAMPSAGFWAGLHHMGHAKKARGLVKHINAHLDAA